MKTSSLSDFARKEKEPTNPAPLLNKEGEELKGITLRMTVPQWEQLVSLTTTNRTKIQPYVLGLISADFERQGLRF